MFRSDIPAALRSFRKNSFISTINLSVLSLGLASCLVAELDNSHELSADRFHHDIDAIDHVSAPRRALPKHWKWNNSKRSTR